MFIDSKELSITQHAAIIEKIDNLENKFDQKIIPLEKSSNEFQTWKSYIIAIVAIVAFAVPVLAQYLFRG